MNMDPIAVECATCLAVAGEDCNTRFSNRAVSPHGARRCLAPWAWAARGAEPWSGSPA